MKTTLLKLAAAGATLAMLAGCIVMSVYPYYTTKDLKFDPGLTGLWMQNNNTNELWQFAAVDDKFYLVTTTDQNSTNCFEAHLFQLKQYQFLDLLTTNRDEYLMPVHLVSRVNRSDAGLSLGFLDYDWLAGLIETNPAVLRHMIVPMKPGDAATNSDAMVYLTADTKELQKFLLKHIDDTNAFNAKSAVELKRLPQ